MTVFFLSFRWSILPDGRQEKKESLRLLPLQETKAQFASAVPLFLAIFRPLTGIQ